MFADQTRCGNKLALDFLFCFAFFGLFNPVKKRIRRRKLRLGLPMLPHIRRLAIKPGRLGWFWFRHRKWWGKKGTWRRFWKWHRRVTLWICLYSFSFCKTQEAFGPGWLAGAVTGSFVWVFQARKLRKKKRFRSAWKGRRRIPFRRAKIRLFLRQKRTFKNAIKGFWIFGAMENLLTIMGATQHYTGNLHPAVALPGFSEVPFYLNEDFGLAFNQPEISWEQYDDVIDVDLEETFYIKNKYGIHGKEEPRLGLGDDIFTESTSILPP